MSTAPDQQPPIQFSVADLLAAFAAIAAALGMVITLVELDNAGDTWSGWTSEIVIVDGKPNAVAVPVEISTDTGRIISPSHRNSLATALVIEIVTLLAVAGYLVARSRRKKTDRCN